MQNDNGHISVKVKATVSQSSQPVTARSNVVILEKPVYDKEYVDGLIEEVTDKIDQVTTGMVYKKDGVYYTREEGE